MRLIAYVMDIGSVRGGAFGWARATDDPDQGVSGGRTVGSLLAAIEQDATLDTAIALGVEAPLWIPVPDNEEDLSRGRPSEGARSCFAPAGGYVTTLGLHQLAHVAQRLPPERRVTLDWETWRPTDPSRVLVWEAFVSEKAHSTKGTDDAHVRDAATAAVEFVRLATEGILAAAVVPDARPVLSLAGTALLWSGRASDPTLLRTATLVVRPTSPYAGKIKVANASGVDS